MNAMTKSSPIDELRMSWTVFRYDMHLDLRHVPRKARRQLSEELRGNLTDASSRIGMAEALSNLGSIRSLAAETAPDHQPAGVNWMKAVTISVSAALLVLVAQLLLSAVWVNGVLAGGAQGTTTTELFPLSQTEVISGNGALSVSMTLGVVPLIVGVITFAVVAYLSSAGARGRR